MALARRDSGRHTYAEFVTLPAHDQTIKLAAYERAGVPEVWLVHPTDRIVTIYRRSGAVYGRAHIHELAGQLAVGRLPDVVIDWGRLPE